MKNLISILILKISNLLHSYFTQILLFGLWITLAYQNDNFKLWFLIGFISYIGLTVFRLYQSGLSGISRIFKEKSFLPFIVGFNSCIILGPMTIIISLILEWFSKDNKDGN